MIKLEIWSDFACPFCYAGEAILDRAIRELGIEDKVNIRFRAYELDHKEDNYASNPIEEVFMNKFGMSRSDAERQVSREEEFVRKLGLPIDYAGAHPSNTRDAHRLMKLAEAKYDKATVRRLNSALFHAYLVRHLVLSHPDVLLELGREAGIKEEDVRRVLQTDLYVDSVINDERIAESYGVRGVPYFLINGKIAVPGAISVEEFKELLLSLLKEKETSLHVAQPHRCTEDSCELI